MPRSDLKVCGGWVGERKTKLMLYSTLVEIVVEVGVELGKNTEKELLEFLRSDESLFVYSNHQELQATANLYNMNINVFTYGGDLERWTKITPDPKMVAEADAKIGKLLLFLAFWQAQVLTILKIKKHQIWKKLIKLTKQILNGRQLLVKGRA